MNRILNLHIFMNLQNTGFLGGKSGLSHPYYPVFNIMSGGRFTKWFDTFAETKTYNETYLYVDDPKVGNVGGWNPNEAETGYYDTEHWVSLQLAVRRNLPNAQTAANRLMQVPGVRGDLNARAGFAIVFPPVAPATNSRFSEHVGLIAGGSNRDARAPHPAFAFGTSGARHPCSFVIRG